MPEDIPKETETIAVKRTIRVAEKLKIARAGLFANRAWWSNILFESLGLIGILALNLYLIYPFFGSEAPETSFAGPIVPFLAKSLELVGFPFPYAIQIVNILFFLLFPFTFYFFIRKVSKRKLIAFISVLFASLPMYPFGEVRVKSSLIGPESSHIASVSLMPIALWGVLSFLKEGGTKNLIVAAISSALVALVSPFGFLTYGVMAGVTSFSEMLLGSGRLKLLRFLALLVFAAGLNSFWYNPGFFFWMTTGPMGEDVREMFAKLVPISFFAIPILGSFGFLFFDRKPHLQSLFLATFYTISFAIILVVGSRDFGVGLFPEHPFRYAPEFGISLAFLLGVGIIKLADFLKFNESSKISTHARHAIANGVLIFTILSSLAILVIGRGNLTNKKEVLGIWTGVEKGNIWIARDKFSGISSLVGYGITGITVSGMGFLAIRTKKEEIR